MFSTPHHTCDLGECSFLITGGAGFIGSNLVEYLIKYGAQKVRVLDNLSTGFEANLLPFKNYPGFEFINGDIRNINDCKDAVEGIDYVLHQAALGSVPRSIADPITTNETNICGHLNMMIAARDEGVKNFVYAASSSTYGDSKELPKVEDRIGKPLSPYAITKYVNELYAEVFAQIYNFSTIGLRYFNVFGQRQDPKGAYAAVIPKFVMQLMRYESPVINGNGEYSRDFTYVDNVIQANLLATFATVPAALNQVYNVAFGDRTTLKQLVQYLKELLSEYDSKISDVSIVHGPNRQGDIPHSLASIEKIKTLLGYNPRYCLRDGLREALKWYWMGRQEQRSQWS
jgi:UDP-N-acetylglucosamine 4-epimerase